MKKIISVVICLCIGLSVISAQESVAFLGVTNRSESVNSDYLNGIIEGILLFDLSKTRGINLVERKDLDDILKEQKLSLYGISDDDAGVIGKIAKADTLLACEYVASDMLRITARLIDVKTARTKVLSVSGETENTIHELAGLIVSELGAGVADFTDPDNERSVFTLKDITPGRIMLYCNLQNAEILLNDEFIGYTIGDLYTPLELPDIDPGTYTLRIHMGNDFGVIDLPQVSFRDWAEDVLVRPGRGTIVRASIRDFNSQIYALKRLIRDDVDVSKENPEARVNNSVTYTDRDGLTHEIHFSLKAVSDGEKAGCEGVLVVDEEAFQFTASADKPYKDYVKSLEIEIKVSDSGYGRSEIDYSVERTDLYQGMFWD